ncbi:hypothetical protein CSUI_005963 [Cystoisospora suis]|uniref:Histone RNA hairpin-binding protein RNA-binding domain-containing protein n=1 Tax=Cystoisospora suis TaxID=483139 RepID=A0A2C6KTE3_9APIC|nr:hypothetical protein CSUI_005963 [Cystoisospora suis]
MNRRWQSTSFRPSERLSKQAHLPHGASRDSSSENSYPPRPSHGEFGGGSAFTRELWERLEIDGSTGRPVEASNQRPTSYRSIPSRVFPPEGDETWHSMPRNTRSGRHVDSRGNHEDRKPIATGHHARDQHRAAPPHQAVPPPHSSGYDRPNASQVMPTSCQRTRCYSSQSSRPPSSALFEEPSDQVPAASNHRLHRHELPGKEAPRVTDQHRSCSRTGGSYRHRPTPDTGERDSSAQRGGSHPAKAESRCQATKDARHFQRTTEKALTPLQISKRDTDIARTKNSEGYQRYIRAVPKEQRLRSCYSTWHPKTPCSAQTLSVKQWRDVLAKWRHQVHLWTNLPEAVYQKVKSLPVKEQVTTLAGMSPSELDAREALSGASSATLPAEPSVHKEPPGRSSEQIARWLTAGKAAGVNGDPAVSAAEADNLKPSARPILFVPSWFRTVLHRKNFDIADEKDIKRAVEKLSEDAEKCSSTRRALINKSADFLYSVYGSSCASLKALLEDSCALTANEAGRQLHHEEVPENKSLARLSDQKMQDLPLDIKFRLSHRQPDLVGTLQSSVRLNSEEGHSCCIADESDTVFFTRVRRLQRQCAVALMNQPAARVGVCLGRKGGRKFLEGLVRLEPKRRRFR